MERPEAIKKEAERARRIAALSHNQSVVKILIDYAEELERCLEQCRDKAGSVG
ncbi:MULTISPECIES: hypothetical protein [Sphingomonadales]|uniref:Uncharacterized protein n=1 Tax=Edaphosphingomonas haloaromaticamans TaxID=653954 RepID=A0A1S1HC87_9SPHN|nr:MULTISPECIES: hypothetical protein [Sphingomonas]MDX3884725.1 hypothetical protein [Sphingomonas sp.]OHT19747.1 hypothetical protein BHE75_01736 [Sphingomonas haloaromaticamans]